MTTKCCNCHKVRLEDRWFLRGAVADEQVSYTYCPSCLREFRREIWRERRTVRLEFAAQSPA